jgi:hypothetical protein
MCGYVHSWLVPMLVRDADALQSLPWKARAQVVVQALGLCPFIRATTSLSYTTSNGYDMNEMELQTAIIARLPSLFAYLHMLLPPMSTPSSSSSSIISSRADGGTTDGVIPMITNGDASSTSTDAMLSLSSQSVSRFSPRALSQVLRVLLRALVARSNRTRLIAKYALHFLLCTSSLPQSFDTLDFPTPSSAGDNQSNNDTDHDDDSTNNDNNNDEMDGKRTDRRRQLETASPKSSCESPSTCWLASFLPSTSTIFVNGSDNSYPLLKQLMEGKWAPTATRFHNRIVTTLIRALTIDTDIHTITHYLLYLHQCSTLVTAALTTSQSLTSLTLSLSVSTMINTRSLLTSKLLSLPSSYHIILRILHAAYMHIVTTVGNASSSSTAAVSSSTSSTAEWSTLTECCTLLRPWLPSTSSSLPHFPTSLLSAIVELLSLPLPSSMHHDDDKASSSSSLSSMHRDLTGVVTNTTITLPSSTTTLSQSCSLMVLSRDASIGRHERVSRHCVATSYATPYMIANDAYIVALG